jgi:hypothetical protein
MQKVIIQQKKRKKPILMERKKIAWESWVYRVMALLFLATVVFVLFFSYHLSITSIKISGLEEMPEAPIQTAIEGYLDGKCFKWLDKNNLILINTKDLEKKILANFKRIESVRISRVFPHTLEVSVKERKLLLLVCSANVCYTLNETGDAYPADNFTKDELAKENLITLNDLSNIVIAPGEKPLEPDFQTFVLGLASVVYDETGISLKNVYTTPNRMSGDLDVETDGNFKIYFNESVGLKKSVLMLHAVLNNEIGSDRQKDLEYIDLRLSNKVFYKFKGDVQNATNPSAINANVVNSPQEKNQAGVQKK